MAREQRSRGPEGPGVGELLDALETLSMCVICGEELNSDFAGEILVQADRIHANWIAVDDERKGITNVK